MNKTLRYLNSPGKWRGQDTFFHSRIMALYFEVVIFIPAPSHSQTVPVQMKVLAHCPNRAQPQCSWTSWCTVVSSSRSWVLESQAVCGAEPNYLASSGAQWDDISKSQILCPTWPFMHSPPNAALSALHQIYINPSEGCDRRVGSHHLFGLSGWI